jgi:membrane-associated protease RseP (regulator of RpoE activity)
VNHQSRTKPGMRRVSTIFACLICVLVFVALWWERSRVSQPASSSIHETAQAAATNLVEFAKSRMTGGIGVIFSVDPATGLPTIHAVAIGSPAERAGLRAGDMITKVDGVSVRGRPEAQVAENIRGMSFGSVTIDVSRGGATNLQYVVPRSSWGSLRRLSFNPYE